MRPDEYEDIKGPASKTDRIIRIYSNRCVLTARACYVLFNPTNPRIGFRVGKNGVFIIPDAQATGFRVTMRKGRNCGYINSVRLCRILIDKLGATGAYRIDDNPTKFPDGLCYLIQPMRLN